VTSTSEGTDSQREVPTIFHGTKRITRPPAIWGGQALAPVQAQLGHFALIGFDGDDVADLGLFATTSMDYIDDPSLTQRIYRGAGDSNALQRLVDQKPFVRGAGVDPDVHGFISAQMRRKPRAGATVNVLDILERPGLELRIGAIHCHR